MLRTRKYNLLMRLFNPLKVCTLTVLLQGTQCFKMDFSLVPNTVKTSALRHNLPEMQQVIQMFVTAFQNDQY